MATKDLRTTTGLLLLSSDGYYLGPQGQLPRRPIWDKAFLLWHVKDKRVLCSANTLKTLPRSVRNAALTITTNPDDQWEVNLGIDTFKQIPDVFYITTGPRAFLAEGAKPFRFACLVNHKLVCDTKELRIYVRRSML